MHAAMVRIEAYLTRRAANATKGIVVVTKTESCARHFRKWHSEVVARGHSDVATRRAIAEGEVRIETFANMLGGWLTSHGYLAGVERGEWAVTDDATEIEAAHALESRFGRRTMSVGSAMESVEGMIRSRRVREALGSPKGAWVLAEKEHWRGSELELMEEIVPSEAWTMVIAERRGQGEAFVRTGNLFRLGEEIERLEGGRPVRFDAAEIARRLEDKEVVPPGSIGRAQVVGPSGVVARSAPEVTWGGRERTRRPGNAKGALCGDPETLHRTRRRDAGVRGRIRKRRGSKKRREPDLHLAQ